MMLVSACADRKACASPPQMPPLPPHAAPHATVEVPVGGTQMELATPRGTKR